MKKYRIEREKFKIGLLNGLIIPSVGRSGGLALLWCRDIKVEIQSLKSKAIIGILLMQ